MSKSKEPKLVSRPDIGKAVKNADGEPENPFNRVLQDTAYIFPLCPFQQGQTDARYDIIVHRRDLDEWKRLLLKNPLTKEEHKTFSQLTYNLAEIDRLTIKELQLIGQTVGSYDMDTIGDFLIRHCNVPQSELNDLSWPDILKRLSVLLFSLRRMKELQADLAEKPAETGQGTTTAKRKGKRGRPVKYGEKKIERMEGRYTELVKSLDKKAVWNTIAGEESISDGKAAEMAVRRWRKNYPKKNK